MGLEYKQAGESVYGMADQILADHHPELLLPDDTYPTLCIMFVSQEDKEDTEPPLKVNGDPAAAIISIINHKQRSDSRRDAEILIDKNVWEKLTDGQRAALLDHEITHLQLQIEDGGTLKVDKCGRPKLQMKLHDWTLTGFKSIAERYGENALEVGEMREFVKNFGEVVLAPQELFAH